jgi:L,D-transpeptidase-like protein
MTNEKSQQNSPQSKSFNSLEATNRHQPHLMPLMKHHTRTALLLTGVLAAPLLTSAIVYRGREADSIRRAIQATALSRATADDFGNRPADVPLAASTVRTPARFDVFTVRSRKSVAELESRLGPDGFATMLKINRTDKKHIRAGDSLIIPAASADLLSISPFPVELAVARNIPKLILVSRRVQAFGAYESGKLVRWGPTSTGKKATPTPAGLYNTNWKAKETRSSLNRSWVLPWCFNLDNSSGVSFHKFDLPGYPASHGCVRLLEEDAKWIYEWADQWTLSKIGHSILSFGTPVLIFGNYTYGEKPLWKRLADDPAADSVTAAETEIALNQHLAAIAIKARVRHPASTGREVPVVAAAATTN